MPPLGDSPNCPGRESPFGAAMHPAHTYKNATHNGLTMENAKGAPPPRAGPDRDLPVQDHVDRAVHVILRLARAALSFFRTPFSFARRTPIGMANSGAEWQCSPRLAEPSPARASRRPASRSLQSRGSAPPPPTWRRGPWTRVTLGQRVRGGPSPWRRRARADFTPVPQLALTTRCSLFKKQLEAAAVSLQHSVSR